MEKDPHLVSAFADLQVYLKLLPLHLTDISMTGETVC